MSGSGDIIIKGGSVDLIYDESFFPRDSKDFSSHKHEGRKITRVVITGEIVYDSGDHPEGLRCDIRAITK